jgi:hypothetical protein
MTMTRAQSEEHDAQGDRMQARIHALEHQLQHLLSIQGQPNPARSVQQRSAPPPIKLDLHSVTGEDTQAAREFARQARLLAAIAPDDNDEYLINVVGAKMSGTAAYWFDTRRQDFPNENFEELIEAFSQQFVEAHDVQQVVLASLHSAEQVGSLKELYAYMTSRIVTLKEKPRQAELIMIYLRTLSDPAVRSRAAKNAPNIARRAPGRVASQRPTPNCRSIRITSTPNTALPPRHPQAPGCPSLQPQIPLTTQPTDIYLPPRPAHSPSLPDHSPPQQAR